MGNKQSNVEDCHLDHEFFKKATINKKQHFILTKIPVVISQNDFAYWIRKINQLKANVHSDVLFLPQKYEEQMPQSYCGTTPVMNLEFSEHPYLLDQEIKNRSKAHLKHFQEEEMWLLLYTLVRSQRAFENSSEKIGDIRPSNIFINEKGYLKLACQYSWPNEVTNYEKTFYDKIFTFLSPQELNLCARGQGSNFCSASISEAFSMGLTMLSAGLLQDLSPLVSMNTFDFNQDYLRSTLKKWQSLQHHSQKHFTTSPYSQNLRDIVCRLCEVDPEKRLQGSTVYQMLAPFKDQIINMQFFSLPQSAVSKVLSSVNTSINPYPASTSNTAANNYSVYNNPSSSYHSNNNTQSVSKGIRPVSPNSNSQNAQRLYEPHINKQTKPSQVRIYSGLSKMSNNQSSNRMQKKTQIHQPTFNLPKQSQSIESSFQQKSHQPYQNQPQSQFNYQSNQFSHTYQPTNETSICKAEHPLPNLYPSTKAQNTSYQFNNISFKTNEYNSVSKDNNSTFVTGTNRQRFEQQPASRMPESQHNNPTKTNSEYHHDLFSKYSHLNELAGYSPSASNEQTSYAGNYNSIYLEGNKNLSTAQKSYKDYSYPQKYIDSNRNISTANAGTGVTTIGTGTGTNSYDYQSHQQNDQQIGNKFKTQLQTDSDKKPWQTSPNYSNKYEGYMSKQIYKNTPLTMSPNKVDDDSPQNTQQRNRLTKQSESGEKDKSTLPVNEKRNQLGNRLDINNLDTLGQSATSKATGDPLASDTIDNDFIKKIQEQLEQSRKSFPSRTQ